jgi:hypothetical protein
MQGQFFIDEGCEDYAGAFGGHVGSHTFVVPPLLSQWVRHLVDRGGTFPCGVGIPTMKVWGPITYSQRR